MLTPEQQEALQRYRETTKTYAPISIYSVDCPIYSSYGYQNPNEKEKDDFDSDDYMHNNFNRELHFI